MSKYKRRKARQELMVQVGVLVGMVVVVAGIAAVQYARWVNIINV